MAESVPTSIEQILISRLSVTREQMVDFCNRWNLAEMPLFGSVLMNEFSEDSDVDLLVEFKPDCSPGLEFVAMCDELSVIFRWPVDVLTRSSVETSENYIRRREILGSARTIHEEG